MNCPNCSPTELVKMPKGWYECPVCHSTWIGVKDGN